MAVIESDIDLLRYLGLTENEAANFLYRTRQTVNQALARGERYFKPCDILALRLAAGCKADLGPGGAVIDIDVVADYVERKWNAQAAEQVRTGYGAITAVLDPSKYDEVWVVVPDAGYLATSMPDQAHFLRTLPSAAPETGILYMFGSPLERRVFENQVFAGNADPANVRYLSESLLGAQLTMVIGNPRQTGKTPEFWVLSHSGFQKAVNTSPEITALQLQDTIPRFAELAPMVEVKRAQQPG